MTETDEIAALWSRVPVGESAGTAFGRRWRAARTVHAGGRAEKIVAKALDGSGYMSCNRYDLGSGPRIAPCEMPVADVLAFLRSYRAEREGPRRSPGAAPKP